MPQVQSQAAEFKNGQIAPSCNATVGVSCHPAVFASTACRRREGSWTRKRQPSSLRRRQPMRPKRRCATPCAQPSRRRNRWQRCPLVWKAIVCPPPGTQLTAVVCRAAFTAYNRNGLQCEFEHYTAATLPPSDLAQMLRLQRASGTDGARQRQRECDGHPSFVCLVTVWSLFSYCLVTVWSLLGHCVGLTPGWSLRTVSEDDARLLVVRAVASPTTTTVAAPGSPAASPASPAASPVKEAKAS
jgi:hypothetical protein